MFMGNNNGHDLTVAGRNYLNGNTGPVRKNLSIIFLQRCNEPFYKLLVSIKQIELRIC